MYVGGDDYSASIFEENYNAQDVYDQMKLNGTKSMQLDCDDYIEVTIYEFGSIDDNFIDFVKDRLCDYDQLKATDIFEVKP